MNREEGARREAAAEAPVATLRDVEILRAAIREPFESELRGPSMAPTIPGGSVIRIAPAKAGAWLPGEVVAFLADSRVMVHRVVYVGRGAAQGFVITQGDGNWMCDPPIAAEAIAGGVEEYREAGEWRPVGPAPRSTGRRLVSFPTFAVLRLALEWRPPVAMRLARAMSYVRMILRWPLTVLTQRQPGHVRD